MPHSATEPCCPPFDPALWDEKTHVWNDKPFIKDSMRVFFHIPFPPMIRKLLSRMWDKVKAAGANADEKDVLVMATDPTPWRTEWYMSITKDVPGAENVKLSGTFITRVFDGPYNAVPKWIRQMDQYLAKQGKKSKRYFFHYTSCPKCAKLRGHNYVIAFAEVD